MGILTNHTGEPFDGKQAELLVSKINDKGYRAMMIFGLSSGVSKEEVTQVTSDTINYPKQIISIWDKFQNRQRSIYVSDKVLNILKDYSEMNFKPNEKIFNYSLTTIENVALKYSNEALNLNRTWLAVRRSFVRMAVDAGYPIELTLENTGAKLNDIFKYYKLKNYNPVEEVNKKPLFNLGQRRII